MFNSFFMEATRVTGSLLLPTQKPILLSVIALPGIVAGGGAALEKATAETRWRDGIPKDAQRCDI
jgi:hypothetical protein